MKVFPSNEFSHSELGDCVCLVPETASDRDVIRILAKSKITSISASSCLGHTALRATLIDEEAKTNTVKLAEALYSAMRPPGVRPWSTIDSTERKRIVNDTQGILDKLKAILQAR